MILTWNGISKQILSLLPKPKGKGLLWGGRDYKVLARDWSLYWPEARLKITKGTTFPNVEEDNMNTWTLEFYSYKQPRLKKTYPLLVDGKLNITGLKAIKKILNDKGIR